MTIGTNSTSDPPATRELALMDAIDSLSAENTRSGGPLNGKLDVVRKATIANDPANQNKQIGLYGLSWLEVFLVGDDRYRQFLKVKPMDASTFSTNLI